ncbi:hypothetical protein JL721_10243 [Aureococcus anophagefferens]|nr:hypothetical protein JL721_10243 [Aureococcus anophagefferens]
MVFLMSLLGLLLAPTTALKIVMAPDASTYAIADDERTLFKSGTNSVAVFVDGAWKSEKDRTLNLTAYDLVDGDDPVIGAYEGVEMTWATDTGTTVVTRAVAAAAAAVFAITFPEGAARTSPYGHNGESHESVVANWPCFVSAFGAGRLSWGGPFASSAGPGKTWDGAPAVWAPGTAGTVDSIPANFSHEFLVSVGDTGSITAAVAAWGALIRRKQGATPYDDVTLQKVGYQTDNGAFYCFCGGGDCSQTLIDKGAELRDHGAPMGYLSFQGAGASSGRGQAAPCDYFNETSPWTALVSNTSREGCRDYAFEDVAPAQSLEFYGAMFDRGMAQGMASFEPDFMQANYNCVDDFVQTVDAAETWQRGMADAALARNVSVQWCYATPTDVLAATAFPAVTNFRVSNDFCYGQSWDVGVSSLLVWALGKAPSKDTLWTSDNNRTATPGCPWTPDHETAAAPPPPLMSGGPVGISDGLGHTDYDLLKSAISADGTLLNAAKSLTSVDSILAGNGPAGGHVLGAHVPFGSAAAAHGLVSFKLKDPFAVNASDFYPPLAANVTFAVRERLGAPCADGAPAASCVTFTTAAAAPVVTLPASDFSNATAGTDYAPAVTWLAPICASGHALLGDLGKIVPLSPKRFTKLACTPHGISATVVGAPREEVPLTYLRPAAAGAVVQVLTIVVPPSGELEL